jgi:hypothetical protein
VEKDVKFMGKSIAAGLLVLALAPAAGWAQSVHGGKSPDIPQQTEPPAPRVLRCTAMLGPAKFKDRPASPDDLTLMRSNSDTQAGINRGDPWIMLVSQEVCEYADPDGAWSMRLVASKNPDLGKSQFTKWQGKVSPSNLGGLNGLTPDHAGPDGHMHELYTVKQNADGGILILLDYPADKADQVAAAVRAAAATQP